MTRDGLEPHQLWFLEFLQQSPMVMTRRAFVGRVTRTAAAGLGIGTALGSVYRRAQAESGQKASFRWRVPTAHYPTVKNSLNFDGSIEEEHNTKGLPLIFVFVGVALLPSLVDAILTLRRKLVQPGILIDARGDVIKIDIDPTLPRGTILLCDETGCKLYEPDQLTDPVEFSKVLAGAKSK